MAELSSEELQKLLTAGEVAELFSVRPGVVRRAAKKNEIPGAYFVIGRYGFDPEKVLEWTPPEPGTRTVGARREDGRQRYSIWLTPEESTTLATGGYELVNPRERSAARRKAKKAAAAAVTGADATVEVDEGNPFAEFDSDEDASVA